MTILESSILQLSGADGTAEFRVDPDEPTFVLTMGKETKRFKIVDLWAITFAISSGDMQDKMTPVRQTELVTYRGTHRIKLKKDMKRGDILTARYEMSVPQKVVEGLKGMVEQQKKTIGGVPIIGG